MLSQERNSCVRFGFVVGIARYAAVCVGNARRSAERVVGVGRSVPERIGDSQQIAGGIVGIRGQIAELVRLADDVAERIIDFLHFNFFPCFNRHFFWLRIEEG